jgi:hypothetical protein
MVKVALLELVLVGDGVEEVEEGRSIVGVDEVCETVDSVDNEDDMGVEELPVADGVGEDGAGLDGVVLLVLLLFGVPIIWPLPIKYAGGALYKVGSTREPKPY